MRHFKVITIIALIIFMALPALAGRKKIKKGAGAMLTSGRIALFSDPPRYDEALAYFDTVLTDYGPIPEAYFYRGNVFAEYATREYDMEKKIDYFAKMTGNYDSMQTACESKDVDKKYKSKCDEFQNVVDSIKVGYWGTHYNEAVKIIERIDNELKPNVSNAADSAELEAAKAELMAVADTGKSFFRIASVVDPTKYRALEGLGILYDRMDMNDSGLVWFTKAYELAPDRINIIQSIAYSYIQSRDWENSITYFQKALGLVPDDINTILNVAVCYNNLQMFDSVYAYNLKALEIDSTVSSAWFDIGQIWLWRSQTYSDSTKYFKQASNEGEAGKYQKLQNTALDSSAYYYCHAAAMDASDEVALEQCAIVTMILGQYDLAAEKFRVLTTMSPQVFDFWINLGDCLIQLQKFDEAIEPYEKAIEIEPGNRKLMEVLLSLYESQGMTEKAKAAEAKIKELGG